MPETKNTIDSKKHAEAKHNIPKESDKIPPTVHERAKKLAQAFFRLPVREEQGERKAP